MPGSHIQISEPDSRYPGFAKPLVAPAKSRLNSRKESSMREWQKPTIDETESGMEVTSYLPAELDRA
jgi:coenzyme PQQ precursor peptide PqqA